MKTECRKRIYSKSDVILKSYNSSTDWASSRAAGKLSFPPFSPNDPIACCLCTFTGAGLRGEVGRGAERGQRSGHRAASVTCWAVHHIGRHAVGGCLGVHEPRAVVDGLAVGRAGSHESSLVHARETALPVWRESTGVHTLTMHMGHVLPRGVIPHNALVQRGGAALFRVCLKELISRAERLNSC